MRKKRITL